MLFTAPADKDLVWNENGLEGSFRFLKRLYKSVYQLHSQNIDSNELNLTELSESALELYIKLQQTIHKVELALAENYQFNTAIAANMELLNLWQSFNPKDANEQALSKQVIENIILMLSPIIPHLCHYLWLEMGNQEALVSQKIQKIWPEVNQKYLINPQMDLVIQVNGKSRAKAVVDSDIDDAKMEKTALENDKVKNWLVQGSLRKVIIVNQEQRKLVNLIIQ